MSEYEGVHPGWILVALVGATGLGYLFGILLIHFSI